MPVRGELWSINNENIFFVGFQFNLRSSHCYFTFLLSICVTLQPAIFHYPLKSTSPQILRRTRSILILKYTIGYRVVASLLVHSRQPRCDRKTTMRERPNDELLTEETGSGIETGNFGRRKLDEIEFACAVTTNAELWPYVNTKTSVLGVTAPVNFKLGTVERLFTGGGNGLVPR